MEEEVLSFLATFKLCEIISHGQFQCRHLPSEGLQGATPEELLPPFLGCWGSSGACDYHSNKALAFPPPGYTTNSSLQGPPGRSHFAGVTTSWRRTTQPPAASLRAVTTGRERGPPHPQHHRTWQGEDGEQELQRLSEEQPRFWVLSTPARTGSPPPCHPTRKTCAAGTAQGLDPGSHGHPSKAQAAQTCPATTAKSFLLPDVFYCPTEGNPYF